MVRDHPVTTTQIAACDAATLCRMHVECAIICRHILGEKKRLERSGVIVRVAR